MKVSIKGVLIGGISDIVATNIISIPLVIFAAATLHISQIPEDKLQAQILHAIHNSPMLLSVQIVIGVLCSCLGGYIAARIAKHDAVLNGTVSSWFCLAIGVYSLLAAHTTASTLFQITGLIVSPLAGAAGGYIYGKRAVSSTATS